MQKGFFKVFIATICIIAIKEGILAKGLISVVGNSQAYWFCKQCNIDDNVNSAIRTNNAVGGSYIWSGDVEISSFPSRAQDYRYCILFFGTNEIIGNYSINQYANSLYNYVSKIHQYNPTMKVVLVEIPKINNVILDSKINEWNECLKTFCDNLDFVDYQPLPCNQALMDGIHIDRWTCLQLYSNILARYKIKT